MLLIRYLIFVYLMSLADNSKYVYGIDGLRAVSLILVLLAHWLPFPKLSAVVETGRIGLVAFFVISGYLITRILLMLRSKIELGHLSKRKALAIFYMRRSVRIFPIYYLAIAYVVLSNVRPAVGEHLWWHMLFVSNFSAAFLVPQGGYEPIAPLWSLCVEEQFYLFWAPCLLFFPKRMQWLLVAGIAALAVGWRIFAAPYMTGWALILSTPANMDSLAAGSFVAIAINEGLHERGFFRKIMLALSIGGVISIFYWTWLRVNAMAFWSPWLDAAYYLPVASVIFFLATSRATWISKVLEFSPVRFLGRRSYGFYVYHQIVMFGFLKVYYGLIFNRYTDFVVHQFSVTASALYFLVALALSILSFGLIERPLLNLRDNI